MLFVRESAERLRKLDYRRVSSRFKFRYACGMYRVGDGKIFDQIPKYRAKKKLFFFFLFLIVSSDELEIEFSYLAWIGCDAITESILAARHLYEFMAFFVYEQLALDAFEALFAQAPDAIVTKVTKCFLTETNRDREKSREKRFVLEKKKNSWKWRKSKNLLIRVNEIRKRAIFILTFAFRKLSRLLVSCQLRAFSVWLWIFSNCFGLFNTQRESFRYCCGRCARPLFFQGNSSNCSIELRREKEH